jgi:hypothetical protein
MERARGVGLRDVETRRGGEVEKGRKRKRSGVSVGGSEGGGMRREESGAESTEQGREEKAKVGVGGSEWKKHIISLSLSSSSLSLGPCVHPSCPSRRPRGIVVHVRG